jgi:hypothetical protein
MNKEQLEAKAEAILSKYKPHMNYPSYYHESKIIDAMLELYELALSGIDLDQVVYVVATDSDNEAVNYNSVLALSLGWEPSTKGMLKKTTIRQITSK